MGLLYSQSIKRVRRALIVAKNIADPIEKLELFHTFP
jgi:hypothetical protein